MCGRYVSVTSVPLLASFFAAAFSDELAADFHPSWNVPPTSEVLAVIEAADRSRTLGRLRWGLVPPWAQELSFGANTVKRWAETIATKPSFRSALLSRRCIIPADGYFEWKTTPGEVKQPYYFTRNDGKPMGFAGIWERWHPPDDLVRGNADRHNGVIYSCAIVTTAASSDVSDIHHRMPVLLEHGSTADLWLDRNLHDRDELEALLQPAVAGTLDRRRVGRSVGNVRNDGPQLIEEELTSPGLF